MTRLLRLSSAILLLLAGCGEGPATRDLAPRDGDEALRLLLAGNARFAEDRPRHPHEGLRRRAGVAEGQHPAAVVLGCADSRVPPELIFDAGLGDLFVVRVAGNVVEGDEAGSIAYAVDHLGVRLVLVLGHEKCGAVTAALGAAEGETPELLRLLDRLRPALEDVDPTLSEEERIRLGVEANVRYAVEQLRDIAARYPDDPAGVRIVGGVYELESGRVRLLD
jgi:carbonic anhydrase